MTKQNFKEAQKLVDILDGLYDIKNCLASDGTCFISASDTKYNIFLNSEVKAGFTDIINTKIKKYERMFEAL